MESLSNFQENNRKNITGNEFADKISNNHEVYIDQVEIPDQIDEYVDKKQKIEESSNYSGDWTLLLKERMMDPTTKEKFIKTREASIPYMKQGEVPQSDGLTSIKPKDYATHYQQQIDNYDSNVERIFSLTNIGNANDFKKKENDLGSGSIGKEGNVFLDSEKDGIKLTSRQKNIIESHEKGHGLRDFVTDIDQRDFKHSVDFSIMEQSDNETGQRERGYLMQAGEIAERMAQLKNYFGFKASDIFTLEHLEYAKENYIKDTELDNNMTLFFKAITDNTVTKFLETINKYPL